MLALQSNTTGDLRPSEKILRAGIATTAYNGDRRACKPRLVGKQ